MEKVNTNDMRKVVGGLYLSCELCDFGVYSGDGSSIVSIFLSIGVLSAHYLSKHIKYCAMPILWC